MGIHSRVLLDGRAEGRQILFDVSHTFLFHCFRRIFAGRGLFSKLGHAERGFRR